jgi:hypothetical protein
MNKNRAAKVNGSVQSTSWHESDVPIDTPYSYRHSDGSPFDSDAIMPGQYFEPLKKEDDRIAPYKRLLTAVLEDAVRCFQSNVGTTGGTESHRMFVETSLWFQSDPDDGPFSCVGVCETLYIEPTYLRRALMEWKSRRLAGMVSRSFVRRSPVVITRRLEISQIGTRQRTGSRRTRSLQAHGRLTDTQ